MKVLDLKSPEPLATTSNHPKRSVKAGKHLAQFLVCLIPILNRRSRPPPPNHWASSERKPDSIDLACFEENAAIARI
ncbi:hypothetical protein PTTG_26654 [Puccinia triticina 1-1 BBBD Race 1]|uniref:Uncharacterized protein n=2 Tax=Puccinia triticina TaxID=208348 RepID=A0A180GTR5_PUCT1|nr:uncharacterized protein PtA15_6A528 [Puccinia triticina]OAV95363.1 hypothetical protein PTTG_26654 [Puccinia triticina 1-1 BBBD Race 1]WAQ85899.1 hypothetical protein PtA15_6A528 [Puccinia triticina]WAR55793.1 hypothetical protein PtB15_6B536 [Puccinia triticina]